MTAEQLRVFGREAHAQRVREAVRRQNEGMWREALALVEAELDGPRVLDANRLAVLHERRGNLRRSLRLDPS